jgi:uroporphyrinogen-III synthase
LNILLTRALEQVKPLESLLLKRAHQPLLFPTLEIKAIKTRAKLDEYDAVIFISANAVRYGLPILKCTRYAKIFAVGGLTAKKLKSYDIFVDDFPSKNPSSEALLNLKSVAKLSGKNILIFRGKGGRETLKIGLEKNHNQVEYVEVYERVICDLTPLHKQSLANFLANPQGVISATSNENLDGLLTLAEQLNAALILKKYPLIVLSERIQRRALSLGFERIIITRDISDQSIADVLAQNDILDKP